MKANQGRKDAPTTVVSSGSREAVETAIGGSKGNRSSTWESVVKKDWRRIQQWDEVTDTEEAEKRANG